MSPNPLDNFLADLKRRRVVRVVVAYLVAAFVLLQVADLLVEPLRLPAWSMTLLVVLLGLGLVLTAVLAWAFDVTPDGIRRAGYTGDTGDTGDTGHPGAAGRAGTAAETADAPPGPARPNRPAAVAVVAGLVIGLGVAAWVAFRPADSRPLADDLVAIMPARVSGAGESVRYLREGMLDVLGAKLSGDIGPRAVDPRTTLHAVGEATPDAASLPLDGARGVARRLGAGRVVLTEVVGPSEDLAIAATLIETASGRELARARVRGREASLDSLTDALVARLLAAEVGEEDYRLPTLTSSLPAMQAYLEGRSLYRTGRYDDAVGRFRNALEIDSAFALAAVGFIEADQWTSAMRGFRSTAQRLAWQGRDALSTRDREYLAVFLGPRYPERYETYAEELETVQRALRAAPDRPELHYRLGDILLHHGAAMEEPEALDRAEAALRRSVELDPSFAGPVEHLAAIAARRGDTAEIRRLTDGYISRLAAEDRDGQAALAFRWLLHTALGDPPPSDPDSLGTRREDAALLAWLTYAAFESGQDPRLALRARERFAAGPGGATEGTDLWVFLLAEGMGMPSIAARERNRAPADVRQASLLLEVAFGDADSAGVRAARDSLAASFEREPPANPLGLWLACVVALWDGLEGRATADAWLRDRYAAAGPAADHPYAEGCIAVSRALAAATRGEPDAGRLLEEADAFMRPAPRVSNDFRNAMNLVISRAYEAIGDNAGALAAARRAESAYQLPFLRAEALRAQGRLAALTGDRDAAVDAYRRYLALRPDPEPAARERDDRIRAELARLTGEGR